MLEPWERLSAGGNGCRGGAPWNNEGVSSREGWVGVVGESEMCIRSRDAAAAAARVRMPSVTRPERGVSLLEPFCGGEPAPLDVVEVVEAATGGM